MRRGGWPPSYCISGTAIQSAMASNMEIEIAAPSPVLLARDQRLEDGLVGVHPGGDVADRDADARRRVGRPGDRGEPGLGLDQHVVGLARGVGAVLAVAGDRADDQPRMRAAQLVEREAELGDRAGLEVLHEHVGPGEHRRQHGLVVIAGEIEHQRFLAAVEPDEIRALAVTIGIRAFTPVLSESEAHAVSPACRSRGRSRPRAARS